MGQYFLIANIDKKQFIDPGNFKTKADGPGYSMKLHHICKGKLAGVLPFLLTSSDYYPSMGSWAGDRIIMIGDETRDYGDLYFQIRDRWEDISRTAAGDYFLFVEESG